MCVGDFLIDINKSHMILACCMISIIMKMDMHIYDCTKHDYSDIYCFIYLFIYDSCFEKALFIIKIFLENGRTCYLVYITRTVAQQY